MLKVCRKGEAEGGQALGAQEDRALRLAFRRFATPDARAAGAVVVWRYQHRGFGNWFLCDCRESGCRPPALILVLETYIRRHTDPPWPQHADGCDFQRDPANSGRSRIAMHANPLDHCACCVAFRVTRRITSPARQCRVATLDAGRCSPLF